MFVEGNIVTSDSHLDLGIGTVMQVAGDQVLVRFSKGAGTFQSCAVVTVRHHRYAVNDLVFSRTENASGIIRSMRETDGLVTYQVLFGQKRKGIPEFDISPAPPAEDPFDLLRESQFDAAGTFILALQARRLQYAYSYDELVSLSNARIELLPHQVFVAHRVLANYPHRFLLADEVGLGKTIEAGLILKELRARGAARRVLIVAPAGLVPQWVAEMEKKFNEHFTQLDSVTLGAHVTQHGIEHVWEAYNSIITSLHLLRGHEEYVEALARQKWDLIIFDEAHHLRRYLEQGSTKKRSITGAYRLAERLQASTTALLLLTATPLQLHSYELFSLIELIDPTLFPTFQEFEHYRHQIPLLNGLARQLEAFNSLDRQQQRQLAGELADVLQEARPGATRTVEEVLQRMSQSAEEREHYQEELGDIHRLTSVMLRNRKRLVFDDVQPRKARMLPVQFTAAERAAYDAVTEYLEETYNLALASNNQVLGFVMVTFRKILTSSSYALRQSFGRRIFRLLELSKARGLQQRRAGGEFLDEVEAEELEKLLDRYADAVLDISPQGIAIEIAKLRELCGYLDSIAIDTKAARLLEEVGVILANPGEKVLIFTQFKETLNYLRTLLDPTYRVAVFYGDMDTIEKDKVIDRFRDPDGAQVMIATEAAGEGRNLQFCHIMFNYDLPWNPMRIEQRIGRIDRIGQKRPVEIYNFAIENTIEDRVLHVLHERIKIFESTVGSLDPILEDMERDVRDLLLSPGGVPEQSMQAFEGRITRRIDEARDMETKLDDFILDTRSFRRDRANALLGRRPAFTGADIQQFMSRFIQHTNGQMRERASGIFEITLPKSVRTGANYELKDFYRATFDPAIAQQQEQLDFVAFGHGIFDRAIELCLSDDFGGKTANLILETDESPPGEAICAVYELSFHGIRPRKQLKVIAVSLDGAYLAGLSERFPALALHAHDGKEQDGSGSFEQALDHCTEAIESLRDKQLEQERQQRIERNMQDYNLERQKLSRFYAAKLESAEREVRRMDDLLQEQQRSTDPDTRRIIPATQGRLVAARRDREDLAGERDQRLGALDKQQTVSYSSHLLSVAFVTVQPARREQR